MSPCPFPTTITITLRAPPSSTVKRRVRVERPVHDNDDDLVKEVEKDSN